MALAATIWMDAKPAGYLARIGPAPLRFQAPAKNPEHVVQLPPLVMFDAVPMATEPYGPFPCSDEIPPAPEPKPVPAPVIAPRTEPQFSPQMLFQMFNRNTTNQTVNMGMPYDFYPPSAGTIPAPPSKANYSTK